MGLSLYTAATTNPITLGEAKLHLRVDHSNDDHLIETLVEAATQYAEEFTKRQFVSATYDLTLDDFPTSGDWYLDKTGWQWRGGEILCPKPPLSSVTHIKYYDEDGVQQTVSASVYDVDLGVEPGKIRLAYNQSWPTARNQKNAITVRYVAGYGAASAVPGAIKAAIKLHLAHLYENREAVNVGNLTTLLPLTVEALLTAYKVPSLA